MQNSLNKYDAHTEFCKKLYTICFNGGKNDQISNSNNVLINENLYFLKYKDPKNFNSELLPQNLLSDGIQIFFNFFQNLFQINIFLLINLFFIFIFAFLIYFLFKVIQSSNWNNKKLIYILTVLFLIINFFYIYNQKAASLFYLIFSIIPIIIIGCINEENKLRNPLLITFFSILLIIIFGSMRSYSYIGYIVFLIILSFQLNYKFYQKLIFFNLILFGILSNFIISNNLTDVKNHNIKKVDSSYPFKHTVNGNNIYFTFYAGLSFVRNDEIKGFRDTEIYKNVLKRQKGDQYEDYEREYKYLASIGISDQHYILLKKELFQIITQKPKLIIKNILAKFGIVQFYFLFIVNIFIFEFIKNNKINKNLKIALFGNLILYTAFPLIAIPSINYISGVIGGSFVILIITLSNCNLKKIKLFI